MHFENITGRAAFEAAEKNGRAADLQRARRTVQPPKPKPALACQVRSCNLLASHCRGLKGVSKGRIFDPDISASSKSNSNLAMSSFWLLAVILYNASCYPQLFATGYLPEEGQRYLDLDIFLPAEKTTFSAPGGDVPSVRPKPAPSERRIQSELAEMMVKGAVFFRCTIPSNSTPPITIIDHVEGSGTDATI
jgi:hypothetical protein